MALPGVLAHDIPIRHWRRQTVDRLLAARRVRRLRHADLARLHVPLKKVLPFVEAADYRSGSALDAADLAAQLAPPPVQSSLF